MFLRRTTKIKHVVAAWIRFLNTYKSFRVDNGLGGSNYNRFEICTSLSDKHGRICRQVKHVERKDKKSDWPEGMTGAMAGYIVYMEMLLERYDCDMSVGLENELKSALLQYQDKPQTSSSNGTDTSCSYEEEEEIPLGI